MSKIVPQKQAALRVVEILRQQGHEALFAGGCVRDEMLGRTPRDYDVATSARPEQVEALFPKTLPIGKAFGVVAVIDGKQTVEVATFRTDEGINDGRRPTTVSFSSAKEDALRRDFTINGMFIDPLNNELRDYVNGQRDLERRVVAAIGDPAERFREDHLRMLRAIRFAHALEFTIEPETESAIRDLAHLIGNISAERIEYELTRILTESIKPGDALAHLLRTGLLGQILPDVARMAGQQQPPEFHPEGDVFEHVCLMLDLMKEESTLVGYTPRELAYAVLLHDIGKPPTAAVTCGKDGNTRIRFNGHAKVGADMAEQILVDLKFPNKERKRIVEAVRGHMRFMDIQQMRTSKLRQFIGSDTFELEMALHRVDCLGSHRMLENFDYVRNFQETMKNEPILPEPWINGNDLLELGIREGKAIGRILKEVYEGQMENRFASREEALEWVRETHASKRG